MSTTTSKYGLTKPEDSDPVVEVLGNQLRATLDKLDMLLGETGTVDIQDDSNDTVKSVRVNYARDYTSTGSVPTVLLSCESSTAASVTHHAWVDGRDYTGFTLNMRKSNTTISTWRWLARPMY